MGQLARAVRNQSTQGFQQSYQTGYHDNTGFTYSKQHTRGVDVSRDADNERHRMLCFARFQRGRQRSERGRKVLTTMKALNCRKNEACDEFEEIMGVLCTRQYYHGVLPGQHGMSIAGDRVATSTR